MDIHRCRFVPYPPSAINALAFSHPSPATLSNQSFPAPHTLRLALGRLNGDIEIWNPSHGRWYQESILRGGKDRSIEGLAWVQDSEDVDSKGHKIAGKLRLFSIGYSTSVTEWDLAKGKPSRHSSGNYGEIWCMAVQPKKSTIAGKHITNGQVTEPETQSIAVGCADGAIVLLSTADDDLGFTKLVARSSKKKARVLSITFQNRHTLVTGHADSTIRVYDIRSGQQLRNMTLGAGPKGGPKETLVWSVRCFENGSIVSGDSTGTLCFWDGKTYTLTQRIKAHDVDILDVAVSVDGQSAFSGGMDRRTVCYKRSGGGKPGKNTRWAKVSHSRLHEHDVKAMTAFESKDLSVLVSGGLDTNPIVLPIQQFGREHHRTLSSLPQQPSLLSVPSKRLILSWWDREISMWAVDKRRAREVPGMRNPEPRVPRERILVAKVVLDGDESITSVAITPTDNLLAVSTVASIKIFRTILRQDGTLKVQKIAIPSSIAGSAAKILQFSPDSKWLCIINHNDRIYLYRLDPVDSKAPQASSRFSWKAVQLNRLPRSEIRNKPENGTLGNYHRSINRCEFSSDGSILVVSDLSGYLDTWVLEGHEDLTQTPPTQDSSLSDSSDESDEEKSPDIIFGQHWISNPSASLLPKLPDSPLVLSFRPSRTPINALALTSMPTPPATRQTPHPHSHAFPAGEDRLLVITAGNQILEFHILAGRLSDWSRRNPASVFPEKFRVLMDQAKGLIWDVGRAGERERCWIYGVNWLWMFDLGQDLQSKQQQQQRGPRSNELPRKALINGDADGDEARSLTKSKSKSKRKRAVDDDDDENNSMDEPSHGISGAGGPIPLWQLNIGVGRKMQRIEGPEGGDAMEGQAVDLNPHHSYHRHHREILGADAEDEDEEGKFENESSALMSLRRGGEVTMSSESSAEEEEEDDDDDEGHENEDVNGATSLTKRKKPREKTAKGKPEPGPGPGLKRGIGPASWHSFKYRPILGIVPLTPVGSDGDGEGEGYGAEGEGVEVVMVERPLWDLDLPGRYSGTQEWGK